MRSARSTARDGVRLATGVYLPVAPGRYPVILQRTPYNRTAPGSGSACNNALMRTFARSGYAALNQDTRGRYRSEGTFEAMTPLARRTSSCPSSRT